jgi:hypothetical protein
MLDSEAYLGGKLSAASACPICVLFQFNFTVWTTPFYAIQLANMNNGRRMGGNGFLLNGTQM